MEKSWLVEHLSEIITLVVIIVGNIIGYAKLLFRTSDQGKRLEHLETEFDLHEKSNVLHRTPDFELRLQQFGATLEEIRADIKQLLKQEK